MANYTLAYTGAQVDDAVAKALNHETSKANASHTHSDKQDTLVSGTNIKTVNNQSILGSGNINVTATIEVDSALSGSSTNPVQNKIVKAAFDAIQEITTAEVDTVWNEVIQ